MKKRLDITVETIKIINGIVVDGTGSPPIQEDILISGDTIEAVGRDLQESGDTIIDAAGLHVTPGFIDMHSHTDLTILGNPLNPEKILQGVTTDVVGNCGVSIAPTTDQSIEIYGRVAINLMGGDKTPPFSDHAALFKKLAEKGGHSTNIAALVPQGNIRVAIMATSTEPAADNQIDEMKAMLEKSMVAGAFGMSTGLIYPPGSDTLTSEIIELAKVVHEYGGFYASHIRNEASGVINAVREAILIGKEAGVPVEISHLKAAFNDRLTSKLLATIQKARDAGLDVTADVYPYIAGATSLGAIVLPGWLLAKDGPEITKTMMNPEARKRVYDEALGNLLKFVNISPKLRKIIPKGLVTIGINLLAKRVIVTRVGVTEGIAGKRLNAILDEDPELATERGKINRVLSFLGREQGNVMICMFQENERKTLIPIMKAPFVMIGSDNIIGHPRTFGCYPRLLGEFVREKRVLTIEEAIRKCTGLPASRLSLDDRGLIKPGYKADIVTFDLATIKDNASYENWNAPPSGIKHVFVNGMLTAKDGVHLGVKNGQILKKRKKNA